MSTNEEDDDSIFKSKFYFKLNEAVDDLKTEIQFGDITDKAKAGAKLIGKTAFNIGLFAGKVGVEFIKKLPEQNAKNATEILKNNPNLSDDQRSKLEDIIDKSKK